jgi:tetratricopeptide (TPR) repeat protein
MEIGALDEATAMLYQALYLNPQLASAHNNLGLIRAKRGDLKGALEKWGKAIAGNPALNSAYYNMARIYALQGDRVRFLRSLKTAIELNGSNREAAKTDAAFNHIREEPEYRELIQERE